MDMPLPDPACPAPYRLLRPACQSVPLVFTSPHSGQDFPAGFTAQARLDETSLRRSADSFVDELFAAVPAFGAPLLIANFARVVCDANREPWELDPGMFDGALPDWVNTRSPRVGAGLGTIPRIVATGEQIYAGKLGFAEARARIAGMWEPWHAALRDLLDTTIGTFGACLLVDCHSMPTAGAGAAQVVLGDGHGTTCASAITRLVEQNLAGCSYYVRRNDPYAGGFITRHYGRPRQRLHAIQLEFSRGLYMDERALRKTAGFARLERDIGGLLATLVAQAPALLGL